MSFNARNAKCALVFFHGVEHPAREIASDDAASRLRKRRGQSPGPATHVEHGLARLHACKLEKPPHVARLLAVCDGKRLGLLVPHAGIVAMAARNLKRLPLFVPVSARKERGEGVGFHFMPFAVNERLAKSPQIILLSESEREGKP